MSLPLRYRIAIAVFVTGSLLAGGLLWWATSRALESTKAYLAAIDNSEIRVAATISLSGLVTEEYGEIQVYFRDLVSSPRVVAVVLLDRRDVVVAAMPSNWIGQARSPFAATEFSYWKTEPIVAENQSFGTVAIQFSNAQLMQGHEQVVREGAGMALGAISLVAILGVVAGFLLTRRIEVLRKAAEKFAGGDYGVRTHFTDQTEIGLLGRAFDSLAQQVGLELERRKDTENALRQSEARYARAAAGTNDGIWDWDPETDEGFFSPRWLSMLGYQEGDLAPVGKAFSALVHPEDQERVKRALRAHFREREPYDLEFRLRCKDGKYLWVRSRGQAEWDEKGRAVRMAGSISDVSGRRKAEEELRQNQQLLQTIFDNIPQTVVLKDAQSRCLMVNRAWTELYGIPAEEVVGRHTLEVPGRPEQDRVDAFKEDQAALAGKGETKVFEHQRTTREGTRVHMQNLRVPLKDDQGNVVGLVAIALDVTRQRGLEEQLRQAQKMEAVGLLAGGIAHEFNNLLQMVLGFNALALEKTPPEDQRREWLERVEEAANRGAGMVRQLLGFSRLQPLRPAAINVNEVAASLAKVAGATLGDQVELKTRLEPGLRDIIADPGVIEQALLNLLINGRDAMPNGGVLTIETGNAHLDDDFCRRHAWARAGEFVRIAVSDTGEGMSKEVLERIFQPFFTTKGPQKGTGLGLSMVFGQVEQHHGLINVTSEPGQGSTFALYFPAAQGPRLPAVEKAVEKSRGPARGKGTVLVAEDEAGLRFLTSGILEPAGYRVITAHNGEEALRLFKKHGKEIDGILFDVVMPRMGGIEAYKRIRAENPGLPVVFQTGYGLQKDDAAFLQSEGLTVLHKPFPPQKLKKTLEEMLAGRG